MYQQQLVQFQPGTPERELIAAQGRMLSQLANGPRGTGSAQVQHTAKLAAGRPLGQKAIVTAQNGVIAARPIAVQAAYNVPVMDQLGEIAAVQRWVQNNVRYTMDPYMIEKFSSPEALLNGDGQGPAVGDCDDMAGLTAAMLASLGYPSAVIITGRDGYQHVTTGVRPLHGPLAHKLHSTNSWITVETTPVYVNGQLTRNPPLGWFNPTWNTYKVYEVNP